jgi:hypothetical protein
MNGTAFEYGVPAARGVGAAIAVQQPSTRSQRHDAADPFVATASRRWPDTRAGGQPVMSGQVATRS